MMATLLTIVFVVSYCGNMAGWWHIDDKTLVFLFSANVLKYLSEILYILKWGKDG
jgi:hypothetical protein